MNDFSDEGCVQAESCRQISLQMEESLVFLGLKFFYNSISETRFRRVVLGFAREIVQYTRIKNFVFYFTAKN